MPFPKMARFPWVAVALVLAGGSAAGVAAGGAVTSGLAASRSQADDQSWAERFRQSPAAPDPSGHAAADPTYASGDGASADAAPPVAAPDPAGLQRVADSCANCSDYDLGYRWAERERIGDVSQCLAFSWSYQRGCLAYAREGRARDPGI